MDTSETYGEYLDRKMFFKVAKKYLKQTGRTSVSREWVYYFCAYINAGHKSPADDEERVEAAIRKFRELGIEVTP